MNPTTDTATFSGRRRRARLAGAVQWTSNGAPGSPVTARSRPGASCSDSRVVPPAATSAMASLLCACNLASSPA